MVKKGTDLVVESLRIVAKSSRIDVEQEMDRMGFSKNADQTYQLSVFACPVTKSLDDNGKRFALRNINKITSCYCHAKSTDILLKSVREKSLSNYLMGIMQNNSDDVKYIVVNAIDNAKVRDLPDKEAIELATNALKNAGFVLEGQQWVRKSNWPVMSMKIWKFWLNEFVNCEFDKDAAWALIKKFCRQDPRYSLLKDQKYNVWYIKNGKLHVDDIFEKSIREHLKAGGTYIMKLSKRFECFIPLEVVEQDGKKLMKVRAEKKVVDGKEKTMKYLSGIASNTMVDREMDRMSSNFIGKMIKTGSGLTLFYEHRHDIEHTLGFIDKTFGDKDSFGIDAALEDESENPLVKSILSKIEHGTKLGFSVYGSITEAEKSYDQNLQKEITDLIDGELDEVSLTAWPAAFDTWANAIQKSLKEVKTSDASNGNREQFDMSKGFTHNSNAAPNEPAWASVDKGSLPRSAFAEKGDGKKKSTWNYSHHWVKNGTKGSEGVFSSGEMYLHKGGLDSACAAAANQKASPAIVAHLQAHRTAFGLNKAAEEMKSLGNDIDCANDLKKVVDDPEVFNDIINKYQQELKNSETNGMTIEEKILKAKEVTQQFAAKVAIKMLDILKQE